MILILLSSLIAQEKSAQEILDAMARKIDQANSVILKTTTEGASRSDRGISTWRSSLTFYWAEGNKAHLTVKVQREGAEYETTYVSDGKSTVMVAKHPDRISTESKDTPSNLGSSLKKTLLPGRTEFVFASLFSSFDLLEEGAKELKSSAHNSKFGILDFKFEDGERHPRPGRSESQFTLYYDSKTLLPTKRFVHFERRPERSTEPRIRCGCEPSEYLETWTSDTLEQLSLDKVIPKDLFELPKDKR